MYILIVILNYFEFFMTSLNPDYTVKSGNPTNYANAASGKPTKPSASATISKDKITKSFKSVLASEVSPSAAPIQKFSFKSVVMRANSDAAAAPSPSASPMPSPTPGLRRLSSSSSLSSLSSPSLSPIPKTGSASSSPIPLDLNRRLSTSSTDSRPGSAFSGSSRYSAGSNMSAGSSVGLTPAGSPPRFFKPFEPDYRNGQEKCESKSNAKAVEPKSVKPNAVEPNVVKPKKHLGSKVRAKVDEGIQAQAISVDFLAQIRFSQDSVSYDVNLIEEAMKKNGYQIEGAIWVVKMPDDGYTSFDNRRLLAAQKTAKVWASQKKNFVPYAFIVNHTMMVDRCYYKSSILGQRTKIETIIKDQGLSQQDAAIFRALPPQIVPNSWGEAIMRRMQIGSGQFHDGDSWYFGFDDQPHVRGA